MRQAKIDALGLWMAWSVVLKVLEGRIRRRIIAEQRCGGVDDCQEEKQEASPPESQPHG
jgi:hypothetical protein